MGNIFNFGTKKCEQLDLYYTNAQGNRIPVWLGSYGIGIRRLMGVIVETFSDAAGLVWPMSVAPYQAHLLVLGADEDVFARARLCYDSLQKAGIEVLFDDRDANAGEKLSDADLLGLPLRWIVSKKTGENIEWKLRAMPEVQSLSIDQVIEKINQME